LHTCRFSPHSKGDDTRTEEEVAAMRKTRDPIAIQGTRLAPAEQERIDGEVEKEIQNAFRQALADPDPIMNGEAF